MRNPGFVFLLALTALPLFAQDLSFTLDSDFGLGSTPDLAASPGPPCLPPACVLFSGTLLDNDTDGSFLSLEDISVTFLPDPASGGLTPDNTFEDGDVPFLLIGDPDYQDDGAPAPNEYSGPIFGIDIAPGTPMGDYTGTVTIDVAGGTGDPDFNGFTVSQQITVDVAAPEPATGWITPAGLAAVALFFGIRRKWHCFAALR